MLRDIREPDWKIFRKIRVNALDRFCQRVLDEISRIASDTGQTSHQRYLAVYKLLQKRDDELADAFNNPRRSAALPQLAHMRGLELLTDEEFALFSSDTLGAVNLLLGIQQD